MLDTGIVPGLSFVFGFEGLSITQFLQVANTHVELRRQSEQNGCPCAGLAFEAILPPTIEVVIDQGKF